jgi:hypothetical protein
MSLKIIPEIMSPAKTMARTQGQNQTTNIMNIIPGPGGAMPTVQQQ